MLQFLGFLFLLCESNVLDSSFDALLQRVATTQLVVLADNPIVALICSEAACCSFAEVTGLVRSKPPSCAGSANMSHICSPEGGSPVSTAIKCEWIAFSKDSRSSSSWYSPQSVSKGNSTLKIAQQAYYAPWGCFHNFTQIFHFIHPAFDFLSTY